jgi:hypothetical protein
MNHPARHENVGAEDPSSAEIEALINAQAARAVLPGDGPEMEGQPESDQPESDQAGSEGGQPESDMEMLLRSLGDPLAPPGGGCEWLPRWAAMSGGPPEPAGLAAIASDVKALQDQAADLSDDLSTIKAQALALKIQNSNLMEEIHRVYAAVAAIDRRLQPQSEHSAGLSARPV